MWDVEYNSTVGATEIISAPARACIVAKSLPQAFPWVSRIHSQSPPTFHRPRRPISVSSGCKELPSPYGRTNSSDVWRWREEHQFCDTHSGSPHLPDGLH